MGKRVFGEYIVAKYNSSDLLVWSQPIQHGSYKAHDDLSALVAISLLVTLSKDWAMVHPLPFGLIHGLNVGFC